MKGCLFLFFDDRMIAKKRTAYAVRGQICTVVPVGSLHMEI
jgi:hypothetical protein